MLTDIGHRRVRPNENPHKTADAHLTRRCNVLIGSTGVKKRRQRRGVFRGVVAGRAGGDRRLAPALALDLAALGEDHATSSVGKRPPTAGRRSVRDVRRSHDGERPPIQEPRNCRDVCRHHNGKRPPFESQRRSRDVCRPPSRTGTRSPSPSRPFFAPQPTRVQRQPAATASAARRAGARRRGSPMPAWRCRRRRRTARCQTRRRGRWQTAVRLTAASSGTRYG
jgi:hypothetical protein